MDLFLSEQQKMLQKMARDFLAEKCPKDYVRLMETDERGYSTELWCDMAESGWMGLVFPEKYGGGGLGFLDLILLLEEMGRACLPGPFFPTVLLGGLSILNMATEDQRGEFLPKIVKGQMIVSLAITEPDIEYDTKHMKVTATANNEYYVINGTKLFVPYAHVADYIICVTKIEAAANQQIGLFLVDTKKSGIAYTLLKTVAADKQFEVTLADVRIPKRNMMGNQAQSSARMKKLMQFASIAKCGEMIGGAQQVLEMTVDYAKQRVQFGRPIGSFQAIQHHCANMLIDNNASKLITYQAAWKLSEGIQCNKEVAAAKAWVGEAYRRICMLGHQVHGAIGFTQDHDLQLYSRRAKAAEIVYGDADYHRGIMAYEIGL